jgi:hypothetical protein
MTSSNGAGGAILGIQVEANRIKMSYLELNKFNIDAIVLTLCTFLYLIAQADGLKAGAPVK